MRRIQLALGALLAGGLLLAGCSHPAASTDSPSAAAPQSSHTAAAPTSPGGGACRNVDVPATVKAALVQADGRAGAIEAPGATFYGLCGTTQYAVTRMVLGPAGTDLQSVAFQDGGAYPELLVDTGTAWQLITRSAVPDGCTDSDVLPTALRTLWQDCAAAAPTSTAPTAPQTANPEAACQQYYRGKVFVRAKAVTVHADGSAVLTGAPVTVHCGGADDYQFLSQPGTRTVDLARGATITVIGFGPSGAVSVPLAVSKLNAYVTSDKTDSDVFLLTGTQRGAVFVASGIAESYHP